MKITKVPLYLVVVFGEGTRDFASINVQFALSGSGIHDRGTPGISYAYGSMLAKNLYAAMEARPG